jgi:hypothetical protein
MNSLQLSEISHLFSKHYLALNIDYVLAGQSWEYICIFDSN